MSNLNSSPLPTMYDLPSEHPGESGVPDEFHIFQSQLLRETFEAENYSTDEIFIGTDLNLYFDVRHQSWYKRPDWFAVVGVPRLYDGKDLRLSYVIWQEGISPLIVIELLSPSTEKEDLGQTVRDSNQPPSKWEVYERILRVPYYITFNRLNQEIRAFRLEGERYIAFLPDKNSRFVIPSVELSLGLWKGSYQGIEQTWLHWFDKNGNLVPTQIEKARKEKAAMAQRLEILNAKLKELGIDPETI
jgi:Uma2 family endonuclease